MNILRRLLPLLLVIAVIPLQAEGPFYVGGPPQSVSFPEGIPNSVPGLPYRWAINPLTYWTDLGNLGSQSNTQADALVQQAFQVWQDVPTASITFAQDASNSGKLGANVTEANYPSVENAILTCGAPLDPAGIARDRSIVYDTDGSIIDLVFGTGNSDTTLGFATAACPASDGTTNSFNRGYAVLNGKGVVTQADIAELKAVMIHEFGHMLGLDHTQINLECLNSALGCSADAMAGLPTMFPILVSNGAPEMSTPATDDIAGLSELYPETVNDPANGKESYASTRGRISGRILFSDGATPAQGFNVIARKVNDPLTVQDESKTTAVSSTSGFLFTGDNGNPIVPYPGFSPSAFGSRDQNLIGSYEIPGLPPGDYTVEVEAIDSSFTVGSGVGPLGGLGIVFPMPSTQCPDGEFLNTGESDNDVCTDQTPQHVTAGGKIETGTDIILNGTPPRFDAWESGP